MDREGNFTIEDDYWCIAGEQIKSDSKEIGSKVFRKIAEKKISEIEEKYKGRKDSYTLMILSAWKWKYRHLFEREQRKKISSGLSLLDMDF